MKSTTDHLHPGCCSATRPCAHQRRNPESICDTCLAAEMDASPKEPPQPDTDVPSESGKDSPYKVLGVPSNSSSAELKRSFRKISAKYHPDVVLAGRLDASDAERGLAHDRFAAINNAYRVLSDPMSRANYDATGTMDGYMPEKKIHDAAQDQMMTNFTWLVQNIERKKIVQTPWGAQENTYVERPDNPKLREMLLEWSNQRTASIQTKERDLRRQVEVLNNIRRAIQTSKCTSFMETYLQTSVVDTSATLVAAVNERAICKRYVELVNELKFDFSAPADAQLEYKDSRDMSELDDDEDDADEDDFDSYDD